MRREGDRTHTQLDEGMRNTLLGIWPNGQIDNEKLSVVKMLLFFFFLANKFKDTIFFII